MPFLNVTIRYGAETNDGLEHIYTFQKTFDLKRIPPMASRILIRDKELESVWFDRPTYDPETDTYYISNECSRDLERYDHTHHRRFFIAIHNARMFEAAGWDVTRNKRPFESLDPHSDHWDPEHFQKLEKNYKPEKFIQDILGEVV